MLASPFDEMAADYDHSFTHTACGGVLRGRVWERMDIVFAARQHILELGCGTGEDAIRLARRGHRVCATDASAEMIRIARLKAAAAGCAERIEFQVLPMESLHVLPRERRFDAVLSNFGAVNCVADMPRLAAALASRLTAGAPLLFVAMGRLVPWEWVWYGLRGCPDKAFRRLRQAGTEWRGLRIRYPSPARMSDELSPWFQVTRRSALGFSLPPSYAAAWLDTAPRALAALNRLDRLTSRFTASLADHYMIEAVHTGDPSRRAHAL
jgi:SAM-dependent methyltransferase